MTAQVTGEDAGPQEFPPEDRSKAARDAARLGAEFTTMEQLETALDLLAVAASKCSDERIVSAALTLLERHGRKIGWGPPGELAQRRPMSVAEIREAAGLMDVLSDGELLGDDHRTTFSLTDVSESCRGGIVKAIGEYAVGRLRRLGIVVDVPEHRP